MNDSIIYYTLTSKLYISVGPIENILGYSYRMDLIHYSFMPLILFRAPYTLDLLPYYLSIANGAGGVGIFELLIFQCLV